MRAFVLFFCLMGCGAAVADSLMYVDSHHRAVGYYVVPGGICFDYPKLTVATTQQYFFCMDPDTAAVDSSIVPNDSLYSVSGVYFETSDCTGQRYALTTTSNTYPAFGDFIINSPIGLVYAPRFTSSHSVNQGSFLQSSASGTVCQTVTPAVPSQMIEIYPNDPQVTGMLPSHYAGPVTPEMVPDELATDEVYFDAFDASYTN